MQKKRNLRPNATGRRKVVPFLRLPRPVYNSPNFIMLSSSAVKLLIDIAIQYNGANNGDLQASLNPMRARGWVSSSTLNRARQELLHYGFVELTRQGGLGCFRESTQSPGKVSMAVMERYKCRVLKLLRVCLSKPNRNSSSEILQPEGSPDHLALFC